MKAAWYERNGAARDVLVVGEMSKPIPGPGEVLVKVHASGVNPSDVKSRRGRPLAGPRIVPHSDGAGIIEEVGAGVRQDRIGERVWLWNGQWKRTFGTAAEYIALPAQQAVRLPDGIDFGTGACFGIPAITATHAINLLGEARGKTVLVIGAASAVGHYAAQIAAMRGARVIGTASAERADRAHAAGAAEVIDYRNEEVAARVLDLTDGRGADAVIDMDFSTTAALLSNGILAPKGKLICYGSNVPGATPVPFGDLLFKSLTLQFFLVYELSGDERVAAIEDIGSMLGSGTLAHTIGARFSLDDIASAHETVEAGRILGNVVIDLVP